MKFLEHILASLLATALALAIAGYIFSSTLGSAVFWQQAADQSRFYDNLSTALPGLMAANGDTPGDTKAALATVLTPSYLKSVIGGLIPGLVDHYAHAAPAPVINLSSLAPRLQTAGFPVSPDLAAQLASPQTVSAGASDGNIVDAVGQARRYGWIPAVVSLVLVALIAVVMRRRRWVTLLRAAIWTAVYTAATGGLLLLLPILVTSTMANSPAHLLAPAIVGYVGVIVQKIAQQFFIAAGVVALLGVVLAVVHGLDAIKARFARPAKTLPPVPPIPSNPAAFNNQPPAAS